MKELNIDLLEAPADAIGHCANCFCMMGSGVALVIKEKYPEVYERDCQTVKGDESKLGTCSMAQILIPDNQIKYCFNLYGQYDFGRGKRQLNYEAIYTSLEQMKVCCDTLGVKTVAFPKNMGCVRAGGNWGLVEHMIKIIFGYDINVIICNYQG